MDKKRELRICEFGQKSLFKTGGVEVVVYELATRLATLGMKVTCINRAGNQSYGNSSADGRPKEVKGVKIKYAWTINVRGLAAVSSSFFASIMAAFGRYDVVHVHAEGPAFMCWLPKLMGKKVIVTIHGLDHQRAKWGRFASWYIRTGEKNAVKFADEIIVLSRGVQKYFSEKYGRMTRYIPNGVNPAEITVADEITSCWGLKKDEYILFLARLVPEKGEKYLLEAFKKIETDKKLVFAGGSSDTDSFLKELQDMAADDSRIVFTGFVQGKRLRELYSNAYIYCLPSDLEGMPLSLLEAMSFGNCCLTSDILECTEVLENNGVTFKKGDVENLKRKLEELLNNENMVMEYKQNAAEFICRKYNWDDIVEKTLCLYRE